MKLRFGIFTNICRHILLLVKVERLTDTLHVSYEFKYEFPGCGLSLRNKSFLLPKPSWRIWQNISWLTCSLSHINCIQFMVSGHKFTNVWNCFQILNSWRLFLRTSLGSFSRSSHFLLSLLIQWKTGIEDRASLPRRVSNISRFYSCFLLFEIKFCARSLLHGTGEGYLHAELRKMNWPGNNFREPKSGSLHRLLVYDTKYNCSISSAATSVSCRIWPAIFT